MIEGAILKMDPNFEIGSVSDQLERLRRSETFLRSGRLFALLEFLVMETLSGRGDSLKELVIGDALYSRSGPYDPGIDSSVRVEARRLRRKLLEYYESEGRQAAVHISLPHGSYRPAFTFSDIPDGRCELSRLDRGPTIDLAIMPFHALAGSEHHAHVADGLTDEIMFVLEHDTQIRLAPRFLVFQFKSRSYTLPEAIQTTHATAFLSGTLRVVESMVRVTTELSDPLGYTLWSARFDSPLDEPLALQERLASQIAAGLPMQLLHWRPS